MRRVMVETLMRRKIGRDRFYTAPGLFRSLAVRLGCTE